MFTISPVTPEQLEKLKAALTASGTSVSSSVIGGSNTYTIIGHGVVASGVLANSSLTVTVKKKPFFITEGHIKDGLENELKSLTAPPTPIGE